MSVIKQTGKNIFWFGVTRALRLLLLVSARVRVKFYHPFPKGSFILATNHVSHFDPPLISGYSPRKIDWIAVKELFHGPILSAGFHALDVIPVDRSGKDRGALRTATKRLAAGHIVGIFPEGGIRDGKASLVNGAKMKGGAVMLAGISGAPIVPGVILGSDRLYNKRNWLSLRRAGVWMAYGKAIYAREDLSGEDRRLQMEKELSEAILELAQSLKKDFSLTDADFPHSPQERMKEA